MCSWAAASNPSNHLTNSMRNLYTSATVFFKANVNRYHVVTEVSPVKNSTSPSSTSSHTFILFKQLNQKCDVKIRYQCVVMMKKSYNGRGMVEGERGRTLVLFLSHVTSCCMRGNAEVFFLSTAIGKRIDWGEKIYFFSWTIHNSASQWPCPSSYFRAEPLAEHHYGQRSRVLLVHPTYFMFNIILI